jgi:short-subunit dehydrogenase
MAKTAIAIIGATGNMGSAIAKSLAKGPYSLL